MGVLPLEFLPNQGWRSLGLRGDEIFDIRGISELKSEGHLAVDARSKEKMITFEVIPKLDNEVEIEYYRVGGVLPFVFDKLISS